MSNKFILLLVLFTTVFIAGCIFDKEDKGIQINGSEFIPQKNLPVGFTFMGIHENHVEIGNFSADAIEGVYRNDRGEDIYVQVYSNKNPEELIKEYKLLYKDLNYDPFQEVSVNGHNATKITDYTIKNGEQKPRYTIVWATEKFMILVGSSDDFQSVMNLTSATGT
jgi:hypothetical protein